MDGFRISFFLFFFSLRGFLSGLSCTVGPFGLVEYIRRRIELDNAKIEDKVKMSVERVFILDQTKMKV